MHRGFITLHRKIVDWEWYSDINVFRLFTHLILTANWKPKKWHGEYVDRGQKIISIQNLAQETGLTEQSVRTAIKKLKSTGELTTRSTNKYTVATLTNYELYQSDEKQTTSKTTDGITNEQQTNNKQLTTTKQCNNITIKTKEENNPPAFFEKKAPDDLQSPGGGEAEPKNLVKMKDDLIQKQFDDFWTAYPKKVDKPGAKKKFTIALKKKKVACETIMSGLKRYVVCDEVLKGFICHPTTWLNQERWNDEHLAPAQGNLADEYEDGYTFGLDPAEYDYVMKLEERIASEEKAEKEKEQGKSEAAKS